MEMTVKELEVALSVEQVCKYSHTNTNHNKGLALCHRVILGFMAPPRVPARTPTVHGSPNAGRPWVARQQVTTRHDQDEDETKFTGSRLTST